MMPKNENTEPRRPIRRMVSRKTLHARAASRDEMDDYESEAEPGMKLSQAFFVVLLLHILAVGGIYVFNQIKSATKAEPIASAPVAAKAEPIAKPAPLQEESSPVSNAPAPLAAHETSTPTHTVVAGDTLHRIAGKYGVNVTSLEKANSLENNAIIRVGQVLAIPKTGNPTPEPAKAANPTPSIVAKAPATLPATEKPSTVTQKAVPEKSAASTGSGKTYTVAKGDNPYSIAKKLKVNPIELMKTNKIDDPRKLQIGQKLVLP